MNAKCETTPCAGTKDPMNLICAIILFPAVAGSVFVLTPMLVGQMVQSLHFSAADAGYVMTAEFAGMMIAVSTSYIWMGRFNTASLVKRAVIVSAAGFLITGLLVMNHVDFVVLAVVRLFASVSNGAIMVINASTISRMRNPERGYALHNLGQLALGGIGVFAMPFLFKVSGLHAAYFILGLLILVSWPLATAFPTIRLPAMSWSVSALSERRNRLGVLSLIGLFLFYASVTGLWTYAERVGAASGLNAVTVGTILAITTLMGFLGAAAASVLAGRASHLSMIVVGMILISVTVALFRGPHTLVSYAVTIGLTKFSWVFVQPFILGQISSLDHSRRLMITAVLVVYTGITAGPAIAAYRLADSADYNRMVTSSFVLILASAAVLTAVAVKLGSAPVAQRQYT